jgi:uncharacterized protein YbcC (UPF0753/DUF2309 family)
LAQVDTLSHVLHRVTDPAPAAADTDAYLRAAIDGACRRIAPLWPLKNFVAVNPFLGFTEQSFHATCATLHRVARIDMLMPRAFYCDALRGGTIEEQDLQAALDAAPTDWAAPRTVAGMRRAAARPPAPKAKHPAVVATIAEVLDSLAAGDRLASRTDFMTNEISKFCAAYFDEGQSVWRLPSQSLRPYPAWRAAMRHDLNPEVMGIRGFRGLVAALPEDPVAAIAEVLGHIGVPLRAWEDYLHQALLDIGGWAAYARYVVWNSELAARDDDTLMQLLAIRVVWGYGLFVQRTDSAFAAAWRLAMDDAALPPRDDRLGDDPELCLDLILHEAYEHAYQRRLLAQLAAPRAPGAPTARPSVQAAFCIDVRSEIFRRSLESVCPDAQTVGFAGFFGFPIEYVPIGMIQGRSHCPVLLTPKFTVCETVTGATPAEDDRILHRRRLRRRVAKAWKSFKLSAVSSFVYVEAVGLSLAGKLVSDSLGMTRPVHDPNTDGLDAAHIGRLGPRIDPGVISGRATGFTAAQRVDMAEAVLRAMSLTANFARLVLLTGHGSTTVNNPHASSLDCGACGGNTGEANARVAAAILNDAAVRDGLVARGIVIPPDSWFLGCLHDTTTDAIHVFDPAAVPATHMAEFERLRGDLARASALARLERAASFGLARDPAAERAIIARSRDWAQVRPEWGLAGNAAFIAAPRARTRGLDLAGRVFLHDYDWRLDQDFRVLELIMTAPMVVANWINLQYYGSTVNNRAFGSGNKVLHNVAGTVGVLEGNAGDLKVGVPLQSIYDGTRLMHDPVRLNVLIEAPIEALNGVLSQHKPVRALVDNGWLHLFRIDEAGRVSHRCSKSPVWDPITGPPQ